MPPTTRRRKNTDPLSKTRTYYDAEGNKLKYVFSYSILDFFEYAEQDNDNGPFSVNWSQVYIDPK